MNTEALEAIFKAKGTSLVWQCGVQTCRARLAEVRSAESGSYLELPEDYEWNEKERCYIKAKHRRHPKRSTAYKQFRQEARKADAQQGLYGPNTRHEDLLEPKDLVAPISLTAADLPVRVKCPQCHKPSRIKSIRGLP